MSTDLPEEPPPVGRPSEGSTRRSRLRSSFMYQSSCILPLEDGTLSEASETSGRDGITSFASYSDGMSRKDSLSSASTGRAEQQNEERPKIEKRVVSFRDSVSSVYGGNSHDSSISFTGLKVLVPSNLGQETVEDPHLRTASPMSRRTGESPLTGESKFRERWLRCTCIISLTLLVLASFSVAVTCGMGYCFSNSKRSKEMSSNGNPNPASNPTPSPAIARPRPFQTLEQLYVAVDAYLENNRHPILVDYGFPIGT